MPPGRSRRTREASRWALFVAVVFALRVAGFGTHPATVGAAAAPSGARAPQPATAQATRAFGWIIADVGASDFRGATNRCLAAGLACTADDALGTDTTRIRLTDLAAALAQASDPADPGYLGRPAPEMRARAAAIHDAAKAAAASLEAFLADGCAGSIDGVPVTPDPHGCRAPTAQARAALRAFDHAVAGRAAARP
jgi:hypothetical protein